MRASIAQGQPGSYSVRSPPLGVAISALLFLALACTPNANDSGDTGEVDHGRFAGVAETADSERTDLGAVGLAVAVFDRDGVVWTYGTGSRRVDSQLAVTPDTRFRFGSVLKMMTATAVLQQHEAGTLSFDDPVSTLLPDFSVDASPDWSSELVIHDLSSHRGGLYDHVELASGASDATLSSGLAWFSSNAFLMAPPNTFYNYSNPNFSLAGRLLEVADGRSYRDVMNEDVFAPVGMSRALFLGEKVMAEDDDWAESSGRGWTQEEPGPVTIQPNSYDSGFVRPAGLGFASVTDLAAFGDFLMNGNTNVLSDAGHATLITPVSTIGPATTAHYAHGVFILDEISLAGGTYATPVLSHGGDINGYAADIYVLPDVGWGVAVLASGDGAHANRTIAAALALAPALPTPVQGTPVPAFDPATLDDFAGSWNDPNNVGAMTITVENHALHAELPLLDQYGIPYSNTLTPVAADTFTWEVQGYPFQVSFHRNDEGIPTWLATRSFVVQRNDLRAALPTPEQRPRLGLDGLVLRDTLPGLAR